MRNRCVVYELGERTLINTPSQTDKVRIGCARRMSDKDMYVGARDGVKVNIYTIMLENCTTCLDAAG